MGGYAAGRKPNKRTGAETMTRDEYRKACIDAIKRAFLDHYDRSILNLDIACTDALDSLHGIARVCPVEITPSMIAAAWEIFNRYPRDKLTPGPGFKESLAAMNSTGDLTNPPEQKP